MIPGQAVPGMSAGRTGWPIAQVDDPVHGGRGGQHHRADHRHRRAVIRLVADAVAALAGVAGGHDDPHGVDDRRSDHQQQPVERRRGPAVDPAEGQRHAHHGNPQRRPGPAPLERATQPERQHGDHRRVDVDDQRRQRERDRRDPGVVRGRVGDVLDAEPDRDQQRPARQGPERPASGRPGQEHRPRDGRGDSEPPRHERQPVNPGVVDGRASRPPEPNAMALTTTRAMPVRRARSTNPRVSEAAAAGPAGPANREAGPPPARTPSAPRDAHPRTLPPWLTSPSAPINRAFLPWFLNPSRSWAGGYPCRCPRARRSEPASSPSSAPAPATPSS